MRALVINCSAPHYNLGARKLADWLHTEGYAVTSMEGDPGFLALGYDLVCLSVIFSWHAPIARSVAWMVGGDAEVWCGGPGMSALTSWWEKETGLRAVKGLDWRFERQRGAYEWTFSARGCPVGCSFCIVPNIEGTNFTLDWEFVPAPRLGDNNLSALPAEFQDHILRRYAEAGIRLVDANSGFEPRTFTEETYHRWKGLIRRPAVWRFAFDEQREAAEVFQMMRILDREPARQKRVYVLIGNEPIASCYERAMNVIAWGGEPYVQPVRRLNVLSDRELWVRHDWTPQLLRDFARFFNRPQLWKTMPLDEFIPRLDGVAPFGTLLRRQAA